MFASIFDGIPVICLPKKVVSCVRFILTLKLGRSIKPQEDTPLSEMLAMNLEKHLDELNAISAQVRTAHTPLKNVSSL